MAALRIPRRRRSLLALGAAATLVGGAVAYRRVAGWRNSEDLDGGTDLTPEEDLLGWGGLAAPPRTSVSTVDGAHLAVWELGNGPLVVLPHCWGCTHAIWIPVARRLVESGHRVILYDQRGHGESTRGTAPLSIETLANDLAAVLKERQVREAVLAGHSMGGMSIMSLATYHPEVLAISARALVLVATAAADMGTGALVAERLAAGVIASPAVGIALRSGAGHRFVRGVFGIDPVRAQMDLTGSLFAATSPRVRADFLTSMSSMNLLEGIATIQLPTTVLVGARDRLTAPARAEQMVRAIPGARLVTLPGRGHMLPLEDPDAVADEICRAAHDLTHIPEPGRSIGQNRQMGLDIDFGFDVGEEEKHRVEFHWGQLFGRVRIMVDDEEVVQQNQAVPLRSTKLRKFEFAVGREEKHHVLIEKETARILSGARKQKCRAFVDGELIGEY